MQPLQIRRIFNGVVTREWRTVVGVAWVNKAPYYVTMESDNTFVDFWPIQPVEGTTYEFRPYESGSHGS